MQGLAERASSGHYVLFDASRVDELEHGKDSAFALHRVRASSDFDICALLVTVNADADRVVMHAVRRELLVA